MKNSTKVFLFLVMVILNFFTGETRRRNHSGKPSQDELRAFKRCKSKVCVARVSFCIIMKDCARCRPKAPGEKCDCCDGCFRCLGSLWRKCCDCIGLCGYFSPPNITGKEIPSSTGDLDASLPTLFEAMSHGTHLPVAFMTKPRNPSPLPTVGKTDSSNNKNVCRVAFFDGCTTKEDCIASCTSMGSHRYRWFRNGCCQCVGHRCNDYGELRPLCKKCLAN
ncbi:twisted gastrulation protein homolog 1-B-like [Oculina patagonica]